MSGMSSLKLSHNHAICKFTVTVLYFQFADFAQMITCPLFLQCTCIIYFQHFSYYNMCTNRCSQIMVHMCNDRTQSMVNGQTTQIGAVSGQSGSKRQSMFRPQCGMNPDYSAAIRSELEQIAGICVGLDMNILEWQSVKCYLRSWSESGARNGFSEDSIGLSVVTGEEGSEGLAFLQPRWNRKRDTRGAYGGGYTALISWHTDSGCSSNIETHLWALLYLRQTVTCRYVNIHYLLE